MSIHGAVTYGARRFITISLYKRHSLPESGVYWRKMQSRALQGQIPVETCSTTICKWLPWTVTNTSKYLVRHKMLILTPILLQWTYSNQACFSVKSQHLLHKFCPLSANLRLFLFLKTIFWPEAVVAALWHSYTTISARTWISTRCMVQLTLTKIGCKLRKRITISRQRK